MWWTVALMAAVQVPYASHTGLDTPELILCGSAAWPRLESPGSKDIWDQNQNTGAKETARYTATLPGPAHGEPVVPTWPVRPGHEGSIDGARRDCDEPRSVDLDNRKSSGPAQPEEETRNEPFPDEPPLDGGSHEGRTIPVADTHSAEGGEDGKTNHNWWTRTTNTPTRRTNTTGTEAGTAPTAAGHAHMAKPQFRGA